MYANAASHIFMKIHLKRGKASIRAKALVVFDLDGTLAESKSKIDSATARLLERLLQKTRVAVISGGKFGQFEAQLLKHLKIPSRILWHLFVFPASSTSFYRWNGKRWRRAYEHKITPPKRKKIINAFRRVFREVDYRHPQKTYGVVIENRGTQITFSALGQDIVKQLGAKGIRLKEEWNKTHDDLRFRMIRRLSQCLPEFSVKAGGLTSIDVTMKGIDKAFGVRKIRDELRTPLRDMLFVGDALYPGGNDYAAVKTGVDYIQVSGPRETREVIKLILGHAHG